MSRLNVDKITGATGTASGAPITLSGDTATLGSGADIKAAINASGTAPIYACRAWVNFRGTTQSGTATASGLVSGQYTATVTSATQFTVVYSSTTYTINTSGNHEIAGGVVGQSEGVDLTVSGTSVTIDTQIRGSGNVSSITDNGTGDYTANFTTAMPDANYATTQMAGNDADQSTSHTAIFGANSSRATTGVRFRTISVASSGSTVDEVIVNIAIFR